MSKISSGTTTATGLVQTSDTTGNLELQTNNGTTAVTFDTNQNATFVGNVTTSGSFVGDGSALTNLPSSSGPAFSAYVNTPGQSISLGTTTTVALSVEHFDTDSCFDTSTYRFTPNVAGYYHVTFNFGAGAGVITGMYGIIRKNGSGYVFQGPYMNGSSYLDDYYGTISALIQMNGTTDYIDFGFYQDGGTGTIQPTTTMGSAFFVRGL